MGLPPGAFLPQAPPPGSNKTPHHGRSDHAMQCLDLGINYACVNNTYCLNNKRIQQASMPGPFCLSSHVKPMKQLPHKPRPFRSIPKQPITRIHGRPNKSRNPRDLQEAQGATG
ncbi:hypothetical protein BC938DRAFT_476737 [Jimgerdemannia flammicorona]|uniref:Uncharacterized protein n=1 Tax=Jimgerdemannia flammicorona TaxID=994334 RepID=A0A433PEL3_9FUNG|nr:hypothetical protein BC938DRAFT_476737 [Jimgerdemannia flammicorona]